MSDNADSESVHWRYGYALQALYQVATDQCPTAVSPAEWASESLERLREITPPEESWPLLDIAIDPDREVDI